MLPASIPPAARQGNTLREMLAAKRKERDEEMARRRLATTPGQSTTPRPSTVPGPSSAPGPSTILRPSTAPGPSTILRPSTTPGPTTTPGSSTAPRSSAGPGLPATPGPSAPTSSASQPAHPEPTVQARPHSVPVIQANDAQTIILAARVETAKQEGKTEHQSPQSQFHAPLLGPAEYAVPLPLNTKAPTPDIISQKMMYVREIANNYADIESYLELRGEDSKNSVIDITKRCARIATHTHLVYPIKPLSGEDKRKEADFLAATSAKFLFLKKLFAIILDEGIKVGIVAEAPQSIDMLEVFFRGLRVSHRRLDRMSTCKPLSDNKIQGLVQVYLIPSCHDSGMIGNSCHILIAMDATFDPHVREVAQARQDLFDPNKLAPVLRLVTVNTIEHALLCIPSDPKLFPYASVEAIKLLRHEAGMVEPTYAAAIADAPAKTGAWIKKRFQGELGIPQLQELPLFDTVALAQTQTKHGVGGHGDKRKRQDSPSETQDISELGLKKRKLQPSLVTLGDFTRISSTLPSQSQRQDYAIRPSAPGPQVDDAGRTPIIADIETESGPEPLPARPVMPIGWDPTPDQMSREELIKHYNTQNEDLKSLRGCQNRLQTSWEEQRQIIHDLNHQKDEHEQAHEKELKRTKTELERAIADTDKCKIQIKNIQEQLSETQALLQKSAPETSTLFAEYLICRNQVENLTRKLESGENETAFIREQYQTASQTILEMRNEIEVLQVEHEDLRRRADVNAIKIHEIHRGTQVKDRDRRIQELRLQLAEHVNENKRLQEKVKDAEAQQGKRGVPRRVAGASPAGSRSSSPTVRR